MTKKHINIVLIAVVVALWGTVLYKYVNRFFANNDIAYTPEEFSAPVITQIKKDTFNLQPLIRDPFLGKILTKKEDHPSPRNIVQSSIPKRSVEPKVTKPFPIVKYFGYIKSQDKSEELILLKINNRLERVRLNSDIEGLLVKEIYKDSVIVSYGKEIRSFKRG
ncbi:hypothetical protein NHF50_00145 [Flavobacterium sp. NRK F10]|uniref:hypothetical protein n=1 Tax=Flavobacterium sp. NRK F10 TaxID=2954931 RepID=UPI0020912DD9|nr:hypothetical protein [Flavobacterium sp. NRK F10]MCO6173445.1 hypothetical protein [Flavobacterium sp. NRK F10]